MKNKLFLAFLALICCSALLLGCSEATPTPNNLAEYAVEVKNDLIQPKGLEFGMSVEEVCKIKGLEISDQKFTRPTTSHIDRIISIDGLSDEVCETFNFYEGNLTGVEYTASVGESDFEALFAKVIAQAEAVLPETMKEPLDSLWIDAQGYGAAISSAHGDENTNPDFICLSIRRLKSERTSLIPK